MRARSLLLLALVLPLLTPVSAQPAEAAQGPRTPRLRVEVLSNRADLVSGGDALVRVRVPRGVRPRDVSVHAGRRDVTQRFVRKGRAAEPEAGDQRGERAALPDESPGDVTPAGADAVSYTHLTLPTTERV